MTKFVRTLQGAPVRRRLLGPAFAVAALALSAQAAFAVDDGNQAKPQLKIEAERSPQGARITFNGKGWSPVARVKLSATRAPGSSAAQDFGMISADSSGSFQVRKTAGCTTQSVDDANQQPVTFTAADSASGTKITARVDGAAWLCM